MVRRLTGWMALILFAAASSGAACAPLPEEVGTDQETISGGSPAPDGVFDGVFSISVNGGRCTASKIAARRFLTAAHCLQGFAAPGDDVFLSNTRDRVEGVYREVSAAHIHPSWEVAPLLPGEDIARDVRRVYDVGVLEVTADVPGPVVPMSNQYIGDASPMFTLVGYGCDVEQQEESGTKQCASFHTAWGSYWYDTLPYETDYEAGTLTHHIPGWTDDSDDGCTGDSGGPFLYWRNNRWEIAGVLAWTYSSAEADPFLLGSRVTNVWNWIQNPRKNHFVHNSVGTLINGKSGKCGAVAGGSIETGAIGVQYHCDGRHQSTDYQYWQLLDRGGGWFALRNGRSGLCLSSRAAGFGDGVAQFVCTAGDLYQQWRFEDNTQGVFRLRNRQWNTCLGVGGGSVANGAELGVWACSGTGKGVNQSWVFSG